MIDVRPRKALLALPSTLPHPLLSTVLSTLFNNFQISAVTLVSSPVLATVGAGLRSALVVDIGWSETVVTAVYEYREVHSYRSERAGKMLVHAMGRFLAGKAKNRQDSSSTDGADNQSYMNEVSFEECEEFLCRMAWCRSHCDSNNHDDALNAKDRQEGSATVLSMTLQSTMPPTTISLPFSSFAEPCETTLFSGNFEG